jgi:vacuole morphology and inheritance protein 14
MGLHVSIRTTGAIAGRSKLSRDEIKWQELLLHFRSVQAKHEKARRQAMGNDGSPILGALPDEKFADSTEKTGRGTPINRPPLRRRVTGDVSLPPSLAPNASSRTGALSPLNPQRKPPGALSSLMSPPAATAAIPSNPNPAVGFTFGQKPRRSIDLTKKS